ncbi:HAD family hydrolase [Cohnella boryungensis]|uniref:HAD family hydrolase n=1 Tax=Cohnella boryungensis TaxID=768479 RepID=A0ABV8S6V9_9BACL
MIFACDLDQTLIYSRNSRGECDEGTLVTVEYYEGAPLSYMTSRAFGLLQRLSQSLHFVPTTTRTVEQFERIHGLSDGIRSRYAIVSNGGKVLIDGRADLEWDALVREAVRREAASAAEIKGRFDQLVHADWIIKERYWDELFYSIVVHRDLIPSGWMEELASRLAGSGWGCSLQGRKVYLVPNSVNKGAAVRYVKELAGAREIFAAGDSLLDESMLLIAEQAMAPAHGELFRKYGGRHSAIRFARHSGIEASEDILEALTSRLEMRSA